MKFLITGDWHITSKKPKKRLDEDYKQVVLDKIKWIIEKRKKENAFAILQPGDFFDEHTVLEKLKADLFTILGDDSNIFSVPGQHDMRYHSKNVENTSFHVMASSTFIYAMDFNPATYEDVSIYGAWWGDEIPEVRDKKKFNILLIHKMIIKNKKLWEAQEEYETASKLLKKYKYDLIVSGDNHQSFTCSVDDKHLINCGSLMRTSIAQIDHKPVIYIFDTETRSFEKHYIPIKKNIFDLSEEKTKEDDEKIRAFVENLKGTEGIKNIDFRKNLSKYISDNKIDEETSDMIKFALN